MNLFKISRRSPYNENNENSSRYVTQLGKFYNTHN